MDAWLFFEDLLGVWVEGWQSKATKAANNQKKVRGVTLVMVSQRRYF